MRCIITILILISAHSFAKWPNHIFNQSSIYITGIDKITNYFRTVSEEYPLYIKGDTATFMEEGTHIEVFKIIISRKIRVNQIIEKLSFFSYSSPAGWIKITRSGKKLKPYKNSDLISFNFGVNSQKREFSFEGDQLEIQFGDNSLIITHSKSDELIRSEYDFQSGFRAYFTQSKFSKQDVRRFWFNCGGCDGDPMEAVLYRGNGEQDYIKYFITKTQEEVSVKRFIKRVKNGYFSFFNRTMKRKFLGYVLSNNWPFVGF